MFVNTLALRGKPEKDKKYIRFLKEIKDICLRAYDNQEYPFEELVDALDVQRDISRNPLFDVMLTMQNVEMPEFQMPEVTCTPIMVEDIVSKFDISMDVADKDDEYKLIIEYAEELFSAETIEILVEHYAMLLEQIVDNPNNEIGKFQFMSDKEKKKVLEEFNDTTIDFNHNKFIMDYFEEQVEKTPNKVAIVCDSESITYRELNNVANIVAGLLIEAGVGSECFVALLMERSIEMIIGIFAILKAGGAYVPMDIRYPEERVQYMIKDCNPKVVLVNYDSDIDFGKYSVLDLRDCRKWNGNAESMPKYSKKMSNE